MIKLNKRSLYRYELERVIKECGCKTPSHVLDILFGNYADGYCSDYVVKDRFAPKPNRKFIHRLNMLWVYPLFVVIAPFRYLVFGQVKVDEDSTFGRVIIELIGDLK